MRPAASRRILLVLFVLSGAAGLLYQVVWFRMLSLVLGSALQTTAAVLAAFMAGLALGSWAIGRWTARIGDKLRAYALLEACIGLLAFLTPYLLRLVTTLYVALSPAEIATSIPKETHPGLALLVLRFALACIALVPPTFLMGGTLPLLAAWAVERREHVGTRVGALYAANTWGAVLGAASAGFVLILLLGVRGTLFTGIALNGIVAALALLLARGSSRAETIPESSPGPSPRGILLPAFFLTGLAAFGYEILWTRVLVFHLGSGTYAFSIMLVVFLLGLAIGGAIGGPLADRARSPLLLLGLLQVALAATVALQFPLFRSFPEILQGCADLLGTSGRLGAVGVHAAMLLAAFAVLGPATILMGAYFPAGIRAAVTDPRRAGAEVGDLYSANTAGTILGALLTSFVLVPLLGVRASLLAAGALNLGIGVACIAAARPLRWRTPLAAIALVLGCALLLLLAYGPPLLLSAGIFAEESGPMQLLRYEEAAEGTVTIEEVTDSRGTWRSLSVNGVNVAGTSPPLLAIQALQGHLPVLLHPGPKTVLHIGLGSGGTARAVSLHAVNEIHVVEINPGVVRAARRYFDDVNHSVLDDPRLHITYEDGRNYLLRTHRTYDLILSDSIHPRYAGNGSLYTLDYFRLCRSRLAPGGLVSLWLPIYGLSEESFRMILRSFSEVFPDSALFYVNSTVNEFTILVGKTGPPGIDADRIASELGVARVGKDLASIGRGSVLSILDDWIAGGSAIQAFSSIAPFHTDDRPSVEYLSGLEIQRHRTWFQNFQALRGLRNPVTSHLRGRMLTADAVEKLRASYAATSLNLEGQAHLLLSAWESLDPAAREEARATADRVFARLREVDPGATEPWEVFGVLPALRRP